jgi:hypothetical protein
VFSHPDDPYIVTIVSDASGIHIAVEADILAGGDPSAVEVECRRRSELIRDHLYGMLQGQP